MFLFPTDEVRFRVRFKMQCFDECLIWAIVVVEIYRCLVASLVNQH